MLFHHFSLRARFHFSSQFLSCSLFLFSLEIIDDCRASGSGMFTPKTLRSCYLDHIGSLHAKKKKREDLPRNFLFHP